MLITVAGTPAISDRNPDNPCEFETREGAIVSKPRSLILPSQQFLSQLACDDPEAFEALRSELIENCINHAPERIQPRLRGLQFQIDCIRRLSKSPLGALLKIQAMMWESFLRMDRELQYCARLTKETRCFSTEKVDLNIGPARSACIIEFQPRLPTGGDSSASPPLPRFGADSN